MLSRIFVLGATVALAAPVSTEAACRIFDWEGNLLPSAICDQEIQNQPPGVKSSSDCPAGLYPMSAFYCLRDKWAAEQKAFERGERPKPPPKWSTSKEVHDAIAADSAACDTFKPPEIGMSEDEAIRSLWGQPHKVNVTETRSSRREQWVYEELPCPPYHADGNWRGYLYFEDSAIVTIQR